MTRFMAPVLVLAALVAGTPAELLAQATSSAGDFTIVRRQDPLDDANRSFTVTPALDPVGDREPVFGWHCMADGLNVVVNFDTYFGGDDDDEIQVRFRFDDSDPSDDTWWPLLQGNKSAYLPMDLVEAFTDRARRSDRLVVRVTDPLDGESYTDTFRLNGLANALKAILPCE